MNSSTHSTSVLDEDEWSASRSGRFTHWTGSWVGPYNRSERGGKEKIPHCF